MSFIIPDEIVEKLVCSDCKKYLSVKPVKVYPKGIVKCGRCSNPADGGVISLFGNIAQFGLFPCINRYEGCKKYLSHFETQDHESKCPSDKYPCPLCSPEIYKSASAYNLLIHYKTIHKKEILSQDEFCIDLTTTHCKHCIYIKNEYVFIIYIRNDFSEECLFLNASNIGPEKRAREIKQQFQLFSLNKELLYQTKNQPCSLVEQTSECFKIPIKKLIGDGHDFILCKFNFDASQSESFFLLPNFKINNFTRKNEIPRVIQGLHNVYPKLFLNEEIRRNYPEYYLSKCETKVLKVDGNIEEEFPRICSFCENIFQNSSGSNIYKCGNNHYKCQICHNISSYCCDSNSDYAEQETIIYNLLYFYCKWNCRRFYCGLDLRYHETHCRENCETNFSDDELVEKYFDNFLPGTYFKILHTNFFNFRELDFYNLRKIYVITRDNFNFILNIVQEENNIRFWFTHNYSFDKYYFLIRIKERYLPFYYRVNCFTLDYNNKDIICFAVVLREV